MVSFISILLSMLVAKREPSWLKHFQTTVSPCMDVFFWLAKGPFFLGWVIVWMFHIGRARHPGPVDFVNVGGWLTCDLALDSCAQFLAVAEHRLIPSGARSICHQLLKAGGCGKI